MPRNPTAPKPPPRDAHGAYLDPREVRLCAVCETRRRMDGRRVCFECLNATKPTP